MNQLLLVIRCEGGSFLAVPVNKVEAEKIVQDWFEDTSPPKIGGTDLSGRRWAVKSDKIVLCHTESVQAAQNTAQSQHAGHSVFPSPTPQYKSGY
jgi:hypothetical protein